MKFVCDNCQAKYQIGDEKVAGKTVRMKCRRCGYEIRVRAEVPDGSTDMSLHEMDRDASFAPSSVAAPVPRARPAAMPRPTMLGGHTAPPEVHGPPPPASAPSSGAMGSPTSAGRSSAATASPLGAASRAPAPRSAPVAPAAPVSHVSHTPARPMGAPRPAPVAPRPLAPRPAASPAPARAVTRPASSASTSAAQHVDHAHPPPSRGARPAWSPPREESVSEAPPGPELSERDWYVGIRGTPTGPIHGTEIRDRAADGDIDGESLVWREGMGEWRPLRTVPSLLAIVEAARAPAPAPSIVLTPGPTASAPAVPAAAASVPFALVQPRPPTPAPAPVAAAPAPAPFAPAPVAAAPAAPAPAPIPAEPVVASAPAPHVMSDPFAAPAPSTQSAKTNGLHLGALDAPAAEAPANAEAKRPVDEPEPDLDAVLGRKRPPHPMAYAFIAAAAVFGGVAAWVLLSRPATQIVVVQAPAATAATATPSATTEPDRAQVDVGEVSTGSPQARGPSRPGSGARPKSTAATTAAPPSAPIDTSGFVNNVPGPKQTGPSNSQSGAGGQLSQGEISAVVSQNQPLVKRKCWQPALEARPPNGATNARVNGSITIRGSGAVDSASASGAERDFPGLASCIAARMKGWKFPPSGGSTTVNVPFVFAGQ